MRGHNDWIFTEAQEQSFIEAQPAGLSVREERAALPKGSLDIL